MNTEKPQHANEAAGGASDVERVVRLEIEQQGAPRVNCGYVYRDGNGVVAIAIDMHSKRCAVAVTGTDGDVPIIYVEAGEDSLHLDESQPRDSLTAIRLPEYEGWSVWAAEIGRYTLSVCLTKDIPNVKLTGSL